MARLIMDDWKRFFESHGVQVKGVCRAVRTLMQPDRSPTPTATPPTPRPSGEVERLSARVAELEAELARLRDPQG